MIYSFKILTYKKNTFLTFDIAALNNIHICSQLRIIMLQIINVLINILYLTDIPNMIFRLNYNLTIKLQMSTTPTL